MQLGGESKSFDAVYDGDLQAGKIRFPAPDRLNLKVGAKVIFVKNNKPTWLNGSLGEVIAIEQNSLRIKLQETGNIVPVSRVSWEKLKYNFNYETGRIEAQKIGSFTQFPINLGWAITIHKSQGMTMDSVKIDLGRGAFCTGQTYVALSRCKTLQGIHLAKPLQPRDVQVDQSVIEFYRKLGFFDEDGELYVELDEGQPDPKYPAVEKNISPVHCKVSNAGQKWTDDEDTLLVEEFNAGLETKQIAEAHGRSRGAIRSRLAHKGLVDPNSQERV
jgi:hypothetical protein